MRRDLTSDLNEAQRQAVLYADGPLLVFAGAGSGKTRVITRRIAHAVLNRQVEPTSIVALTFTNKAAQEMARRVGELLETPRLPMTVGTFHSTCARWLRFYGPKFGHSGKFAIYDTDDQRAQIRRVLAELNIDSDDAKPAAIVSALDRAKNACLAPEDIAGSGLVSPTPRFADIYQRYQERMTQADALDFGDLLLHMVRLLEENAEAAKFFRERLQMFLIDEYQDTNHAQYRLLHALVDTTRSAPDVCVVGDDDQSIYRFRGADVGNILAFRRDFPTAMVVKLEDNYRSSQAVLDVAHAVISRNRVREPKRLLATREQGERPHLLVHESERAEAEWLALNLAEQQRAGTPLGEIAVLLRQNAQSRILEEVLTRWKLPFVLIGGQRFYERAEVKDALAYLRLLLHPDSDLDLLRIINTPARGIGDKTVDRLQAFAGQAMLSLFELVTGPPAQLSQAGLASGAVEKVSQFGALLVRWAQLVPTVSPRTLLTHVLNESGFVTALREDPSIEAEGRLANLKELASAIEEWSLARPEATLADYLQELALLTDLDRVEDQGGRVMVMTLHSAKGLEFRCVYMLGLEERIFPSARSDESASDLEEERRLFYVGVTRAKDTLFLSGCRSRMVYGQREAMEPSRFLSEIPPELLASPELFRSPSTTDAFSGRFGGGSRPPRNNERVYGQEDGGFTRRRKSSPEVGQAVRHQSFGDGRVVGAMFEGDRVKLTVDFPTVGRKTILAQYLQILHG